MPKGILFEADVVVIKSQFADDVINNFGGYPAPQHLDCVVECKFGKYNKGQLRELLGLRRHISYLKETLLGPTNSPKHLYRNVIQNANPKIAVKMARPTHAKFVDPATAALYDLQQINIK